ncbi:vacuolar ATP synthase subunit h, putative [Eimeria praecox]|uniref:Vacuolar ATP synthase subunit h, putative n=1 Tax=Eimeria praecox TaxID=51316 RepID=U6G5E0_9EIME|nr:vacuolar ATP synthase subunit h, putative [Eimeria praecox]
MAAALSSLHGLDAEQRSEAIAENPPVVAALVAVLRLEADIQPAQYALTILYEVVRENSSQYEVMCKALEKTEVRSRTSRFSDDEVKYFVQSLIGGRFPVSEAGRLDALIDGGPLYGKHETFRSWKRKWRIRDRIGIVRVGLHVIENFLSCEDAVEIIIEENVAQLMAGVSQIHVEEARYLRV